MNPRRIRISLGNIASLHDGLGEFSLQIGQRFAAQALVWRERHGIEFHFHMRETLHGLFGAEVGYLDVHRWQQWHAAIAGPWAPWHSLHQLNRTLPPRQAAMRLATVHDLSYRYGRNAFSTWRHHRRTLALMARIERFVAISRFTANEVREHRGFGGPLEVILNGARSFVQAEQKPLPGWEAPESPPFLFHLSRMNPSKNPRSLIGLAQAVPGALHTAAATAWR